jgi:lipid-binding SYLF domain-containing protein
MEKIMFKINTKTFYLMLVFAMSILVSISANAATTKTELHADSDQALALLIKNNPKAAELARKSTAVLIFPNIVKAGLVFGGAYGEGLLKQDGKIDGYYNSVTASWGLQIGAQSYGYVVFLMNDSAVKYIRETHGWEIGVGPTVVLVDEGVSKNLSTSTLKDDAYAFAFDQKGLMASLSLEGTKITRLKN